MKRTDVKSLDIFDNGDNLDAKVVDKRYDKRSDSKKNRRNRHYINNILKHSIEHEDNLSETLFDD
ncbi:MAG: hypothetical protein H7263_17010 [Candidatus Sericytochromatia bacterium]|nr:hypothetical protein [Candidatus Sericytochromatia bacterium]